MTKKPTACSNNAQDAPLKHQLVHLFWLLGPAFTRWADSHMNEKGLTPQRVRLMLPLKQNGPMAMSALRDELGVTATNITALVDALEKDGMVRRRAHKTDRRSTMIELTAKAEKRLDENCAQFKDRVSTIFTGFSQAEQKQLRDSLEHLRQSLVAKNILKE